MDLQKRFVQKASDDPFDRWEASLRMAADRFADLSFRRIAKRIRYQLRRMPASGVFDADGLRHVWDEYCLQVQHGPLELRSAWDATVDPMIAYAVEQVPREEAVLLTLVQKWRHDDVQDCDSASWSPHDIRRGVADALGELADECPMDWYSG